MLSVCELVELWNGNGAAPCHKPEIVVAMLTVLKDPTVVEVMRQLDVNVNEDDEIKVVKFGFELWERNGKARL